MTALKYEVTLLLTVPGKRKRTPTRSIPLDSHSEVDWFAPPVTEPMG